MVHRMTTTEADRIAVLHQMALLDSLPSEAFDRITRLAAQVFNAPMAAISLTDTARQRFTSRIGLAATDVPRDGTPCATITQTGRPLVLPDLLDHSFYCDGPYASHGIRFYAGAPLITQQGVVLGALCVMAPTPRDAMLPTMGLLQDLAALVMAQIELQRGGGRVDILSGLPNRSQFLHDVEELGARHPEEPRILALIDLARPDELAHMLQAIGSACVDDLVRRDALVLDAAFGQSAPLYHVAATQFALLAPRDATLTDFAAQLDTDLRRCTLGSGALFSTTCTAGLAPILLNEAPPADLLRRAQAALDHARAGRARLGVYSIGQDGAFQRAFTLLNDFAEALSPTGGLSLVFQPRLELASGRCLGVEALLRWTHPTLGNIPPAEFVPLIEKTTMARPMMRWVLEHGLRQLGLWRNAGLMLQLSVNVSPANLEEPDFATHVPSALAAHGLPASALELEITESALLGDKGPAMRQLQALSTAGIRIAIDDFGTGYSSLSYLQRLPADVIKIDRSFIDGLRSDGVDEGRRRTLVTAMIALSHDLGYRVVAEGIETQAAADVLLTLGCDEVQGYHFGRPMAPATFAIWHAQRPWTPNPARIARTRPTVTAPGTQS